MMMGQAVASVRQTCLCPAPSIGSHWNVPWRGFQPATGWSLSCTMSKDTNTMRSRGCSSVRLAPANRNFTRQGSNSEMLCVHLSKGETKMIAGPNAGPKKLSCASFQARLAYLIGSGEEVSLHPHVQSCANCRALLADLQTIADAAKRLLPIVQPEENLWDRIVLAIKSEERGLPLN